MSVEIGANTRVTLHFAVKLSDGQMLDSTFDRSPATFDFGDGNLLPGFESLLEGLAAGAKETFRVAPEQGFGMPNPNNLQWLARSQFADDIELQEGLMVSFADAGQSELPGVVSRIEDDRVEIDFNHPLAGRDLLFEVEIVEVARIA